MAAERPVRPLTLPAGPKFAVDVECVATDASHNGRALAQIGVVDETGNVLLNLYVQPDVPVVSYLTPLTGLTAQLLAERGRPASEALATLRSVLPRNAVLVGQNIQKDVRWLSLTEGVDFEALIDLAGITRVWNPQYKSWSVFGQEHVGRCVGLLPPESEALAHDAVSDAHLSMMLLHTWTQLHAGPPEALAEVHARLLTTKVAPSFAARNPAFEGVCQGGRRTCVCGAPFLS